MVRKLTSTLTTLALLAAATSALAATGTPIIREETAAKYLRPGDVLFNQHMSGNIPGALIKGAQTVIQKVTGLFSKVQRAGDANLVHVALYVGNGQFAESWGTKISDAKVSVGGLNRHSGERYLVYRPQDRALAARAVEIARRWATGRMWFKPPLHVPFRSASFGPKARAEALRYARGAGRTGGPKGRKAMFCSEFVLGVYQAAALASQLAANPRLRARSVHLPKALALQPSNASVSRMYGQFRLAARDPHSFQPAGEVQVDPTLPPIPSVLSRLGSELKLLGNVVGSKIKATAGKVLSKAKEVAGKAASAVKKGAAKVVSKVKEGAKKLWGKLRSLFGK